MELTTVLYLGLGRLFIYLIQKAPYKDFLPKTDFLTQLFSCDLCLGWWVYLALAFILNQHWFEQNIGYLPIVSEIITCSVATFVMWLLRQGWDNQFREIVYTE